MKRILSAIVLTLVLCSFGPCQAQTVQTPNVGLELPAAGSTNWNIPLNFNFNLLDQILGGTVQVPGLGLQLKPIFGSGPPTVACSTNNEGQSYFDNTTTP